MAELPPYADESDYSPAAWRARISAARLKVTIDKRRGQQTPEWIEKLAAQPRGETERPRRGSAA
jgi:hypothetical protein